MGYFVRGFCHYENTFLVLHVYAWHCPSSLFAKSVVSTCISLGSGSPCRGGFYVRINQNYPRITRTVLTKISTSKLELRVKMHKIYCVSEKKDASFFPLKSWGGVVSVSACQNVARQIAGDGRGDSIREVRSRTTH